MSLVEFIGFVISFLALFFLFFKNRTATQSRQGDSDNLNDELLEGDSLKDLMKTVEKKKTEARASISLAETPKPLKKSLPPLEERRIISPIEKRQIKSSLENRKLKGTLAHRYEEPPRVLPPPPLLASHLHIDEKEERLPSRAQTAIQRLSRLPDLVIYQEILSKPKSLRSD